MVYTLKSARELIRSLLSSLNSSLAIIERVVFIEIDQI
jgi:hypothetical protein